MGAALLTMARSFQEGAFAHVHGWDAGYLDTPCTWFGEALKPKPCPSPTLVMLLVRVPARATMVPDCSPACASQAKSADKTEPSRGLDLCRGGLR